ncbi:ABC transporter substrate-binding protein [Spirillospora sp. NBC_01491]|uniref:ABC transporter substrate-binding protein n=1 Tax=Spirillospora sp. NBC_01491 TaxID=2976007 RepID=UPI002E306313|nr:ABC transporter substrate-binding protein [Spirillospora sp. NBC_01491]
MGRRPPVPLAAGVGVGLGLALAATGCGVDAFAGPRSGGPGTLTFAVNAEPSTCLDPHQASTDTAALFTRPVLDSLVSMDARGAIHPWLARSWRVSADQRTYTFELRGDVRFSDGTRFDAAAVRANLDHVAAPATKSQLAIGFLGPYAGSTAVDADTVQVRLREPYAPLLSALSTAYLGIESPASIARGQDGLCTRVVGTGPFTMRPYVVQQGVDYRRNPGYRWAPPTAAHQGPARLSRLRIRVIPEDSVRLGGLQSGQFDAIASVPPVTVRRVRADPRLAVLARQSPGGNYAYYPNTSRGPFSDVRVRRAFRAGIDFPTIVERLYFGVFQPAASPLSPSTAGFDGSVRPRYDPAEAARLLDEAGYTGRDAQGYRTKDGRTLALRWNFIKAVAREQRDVLGAQVQAAARRAGFRLDIDNTPVGEAIQHFNKGEYDMGDTSWQRADADILRSLFSTATIASPGAYGMNYPRYSAPETDRWLEGALAEPDPAERAALYAQVQRKVTDDAAVFPVYVFNYVLGVQRSVQGVQWEPQGFPLFYDAWIRS